MTIDIAVQLLRYVLIAFGGWLTSKGFASEDQVQTIIGGLTTIIPVLWGIYVKWGTKATTAEVAQRASVPVISAVTGTKQ